MQAKILQPGTGRQRSGEQLGRSTRHQYLPAVCGGFQAGRPVDDRPEVIAVALLAGTGMQAHADQDWPARRPGLRTQRLLSGQDRGDCGWCRPERRAEGVAYRLEDITARGLDGRPEDLVVAAERDRHWRRLGLPQPGRALDIGEQQRDRAGGDRGRLAHLRRITRNTAACRRWLSREGCPARYYPSHCAALCPGPCPAGVI